MSIAPQGDFSQLSVPERLNLIGRIWDSIPDSNTNLPLTDWHREILERRIKEADENPGSFVPWDEAMQKLREGRQ